MNPPEQPHSQQNLNRWTILLLALIALSLPPYFIKLGASSLWDSNEAFYAETPREMIESGDLINPTFNYQPRFNKPPLSYWIVAFFYKLFGTSEVTERVVIVAGAMVMILSAYWLARVAFSREAGLLAAAGFAVSPRLLMFSRRITIDVYLSMFMSLALLFFVLAEKRPERRRLFLALMYAALGLAVMTKGPVALFLPAAIFVVYLFATGKWRSVRTWLGGLSLPMGIMIMAGVVLPWYLLIYQHHGWKYIETFLFDDNLSRYAEYSWGPKRGFLFYIRVLLGDLFPWSIVLAPALWVALKSAFKRPRVEEEAGSNFATLYAIWVAVIVVFFTLSKSKEDLYVMPAYPAAAALSGGYVFRFLSKAFSGSVDLINKVLLTAGGFLLALAGAVGAYIFADKTSPYMLAGASIIGSIAIAGGTIVMIAAASGKRRVAVISLVSAVLLSNWVFVVLTLPDFERYKPVRALCSEVEPLAPPDALVGYYKYASPSMVFYLRRPIFEYYEPDEMQKAFKTGKQIFCVITEADYAQIRSLLPETYILASRPVFRVKLKSILDRVQPPQVLLISNRLEQSDTQ